MQTWIRLYSGGKFHFLAPRPNEIDIEDIATSLSRIPRFTGHTRIPYYVAHHCCLVSDALPEDLRLMGLMHDGSEAYLQDLSSPCKALLPQYKEIELRVERAIARKFKLPFPSPSAVKEADMRLLVSELRDLMRNADYKMYPFTPVDFKIKPWDSEKSKREFLKRFHKYRKT